MAELELVAAAKVLDRFPEKIQSYVDYAIALKNNQQYQQSLEQFQQILDGTINDALDFTGVKKAIDEEIRNLIYRHGKDLNLSKLPTQLRSNLRYNARILFEWNYPGAEFELQFVNPQKRFFTWEHTAYGNGERLENEWLHGYGQEAFEIVGQEAIGQWLINIKYLGNSKSKDDTPTFLRCLVQYNFGKPNQREESYLIRLYEKDSEEQLVKLSID